MKNVLMALGPHRFEVKGPTYESLEQESVGRWEAVDLIGREPAQQYLGPGTTTITLEGVVYPARFKGFRELENLEAETARGKPLTLVSGYGKVFGSFGVTGVTRRESHVYIHGEPQKVEFTLSLVRVPGFAPRVGGLF